MTLIQTYKNNSAALAKIRTSVEAFLLMKINAKQEVFESITRLRNHYGGSMLPDRSHTDGHRSLPAEVPSGLSSKLSIGEPDGQQYPNRYSVVYRFKEQYKHLGYATYAQAEAAVQVLFDDKDRTPVGIYDDRTELFEWDAALRDEYEKASMKDQGRKGEEIIGLVQAMRRRDSSWDSREFRRPSFFA